MMCREWHAKETIGKGPIIVAVDESGSMHGEPICHAKAFALSLAWIAKKQHRWCCLVSWASRTQVKWTALEPKAWNQQALSEWLGSFFNGGTEPPLDKFPSIYAQSKAPEGKTDIILITDACCDVPADTIARFNTWRTEAKARMITIVLGDEAGDLAQCSDEVKLIKSISTTEAAIGDVLSI
jgi:uncharacterized protein with von Willebrand factor type A (vWA) domain